MSGAGAPGSYQKILNDARTARRQTGLKVTADHDHRYYLCGVKPTPEQIKSLRWHPPRNASAVEGQLRNWFIGHGSFTLVMARRPYLLLTAPSSSSHSRS